MNRTKKLISSFVAAAVLGIGAAAQAQTETTTPPPTETASTPPPAAHRSSSSGAGMGVGAAVTLSPQQGPGAPGPAGQFVFDEDLWHAEALLGFSTLSNGGGADRTTHLTFGVGGWYHFHKGSSSDFSLGAAFVIDNESPPVGDSVTLTSIEPGAQMRAFITANVAVHARVGFRISFGDTPGGGTDLYLNGQANGTFGFTYFFR